MIENISIPKSSGCYLFKDEKGQIIYVGKSKYLPKRVTSYFQKKHEDPKTIALVESIRNVDFVITESESEALVVEENLIKLYKPKFNIKGKDDKTIRLFLTIINEDFPRIDLIRNTEEVDGKILAQFTSSFHAREIYDLLHQIFPLRSCSYNLSEENISSGKFQPCLEYQIGNCGAPCQNLVKKIFYQKMISDIIEIFDFKPENSIKSFKRSMNYFSKNLEFEKANIEYHKLQNLQELIKKIEPLRLIKTKQGLCDIKEFLKLKEVPLVIESFDNSHTAGQDGVACSVRFVMGKPEKSSYRKYLIKEAKVGDDYGSFSEVLERRFKRLIDEKIQLPNLVVMDGGRSQVNVASEVLSKLGLNIDTIGISKDHKHMAKWIHTQSGDRIDIMTIPSKEILCKISEEVHRFTIKFHKEKRDKI
jgi:excinuclease ABC subunit C